MKSGCAGRNTLPCILYIRTTENTVEPTISDFLNGTLRPPLPSKSRMQNGAFFSSRDFNIDFRGVGGFLFHVIPSEIVGN